jgi:hypothetical protein
MPIYLPAAPAVALDAIQWFIVDRFGIVHDVTWAHNSSVFVPKGTKGLGLTKPELVFEKHPYSPGSRLRYIRTPEAELTLPLVISKTTIAEAMTAAEEIRNWFFSGNEFGLHPIYIRVQRPQDSTQRQIQVYYNGGLEGDMDEGTPTYIPYAISLMAPEPLWTDIDATELNYTNTSISVPLTISNPGDEDTHPIFVITGPATNISVTNVTTGKIISLTANGGVTLTAGESVTIDTRPATERTTLPIVDQFGASLYSKLTPGSSLLNWFVAGNNQVIVSATGTTSSTAFSITFTPKYRGVLR